MLASLHRKILANSLKIMIEPGYFFFQNKVMLASLHKLLA